MINLSLLETVLASSLVTTTLTTSFIQKTKRYFNKSSYIPYYSFFVNIVFGLVFSSSFTNIRVPLSFWVGIFSYLGSDTAYKSLEGKLLSYRSQRKDDI